MIKKNLRYKFSQGNKDPKYGFKKKICEQTGID